jgi:c-di-GMP-binding flagellar brake protein YcgR
MSHDQVLPLYMALAVVTALFLWSLLRFATFWFAAGHYQFTPKERGILLRYILKNKLRLLGFFHSTTSLAHVIAQVSTTESASASHTSLLEKLYYAYASLEHKLHFVGLSKHHHVHKTTDSIPIGHTLTIEFESNARANARLISKDAAFLLLRLQDEPEEYSDEITIYFWSHDAGYRFSTHINKKKGLHLEISPCKHVEQYVRRAHPRAKLDEPAQFFLLSASDKTNYDLEQHDPGFECVIRDISAGGAAIIAQGRGQIGLHIKLQFKLQERDLVMCGTIKDVYYDHEYNQSTLHMQSDTDMPFRMKEPILAYVYAVPVEHNTKGKEPS